MRFWVMVLTMVLSMVAEAKDLANRLGVGFTDQFGVSGGLPSLAVRYYPGTDLIVGAALGVDTEKDASKFGFSARVARVVFQEDNLNFYLGASAALISREKNGNNDSGFDLSGFGGAEFFLPGLDSLGILFEAGVGVASISSEVRFRTIGDHPFRAGMFFYF